MKREQASYPGEVCKVQVLVLVGIRTHFKAPAGLSRTFIHKKFSMSWARLTPVCILFGSQIVCAKVWQVVQDWLPQILVNFSCF